MAQQPVILIGAIAVEGGPPQKCVISGMVNSPPLQIWGGGGVGNYPDAGFPGPQPGGPTHIWGGPWYPPVIWPGPGPLPYPDQGLPVPQPPIGGGGGGGPGNWQWAYSPVYGWVLVPPGEGGKPQPPPPGGSGGGENEQTST